jgi:hypothetical protein
MLWQVPQLLILANEATVDTSFHWHLEYMAKSFHVWRWLEMGHGMERKALIWV